ncbi:MAG: hypothetical protein ACRDO0_08995, partial [Nocardioidaceae bacterium]
ATEDLTGQLQQDPFVRRHRLPLDHFRTKKEAGPPGTGQRSTKPASLVATLERVGPAEGFVRVLLMLRV